MTMAKFEMSRPRTKANSIGTPRPALDAPPTAAMRRTCVPVSAPMPWIIPTPNDVPRAVRAHLQRLDVLVPVQARLEEAPAVADAVEHEHPAAAQPERRHRRGVAIERVQDPEPEDDQGEADDAAHDRVDPVRQQRAERRAQPSRGR